MSRHSEASSSDSDESNPSVWEGNFPRKMMDLQWHFSCGPLRVAQCTDKQWDRLHATYKEVLPKPDGVTTKFKQRIRHVPDSELRRQVLESGVAKAKPERQLPPLPPRTEVRLEDLKANFERTAAVPLPKRPAKQGWTPNGTGNDAATADDASSIFSVTTVGRGPAPQPHAPTAPRAGQRGPTMAGQAGPAMHARAHLESQLHGLPGAGAAAMTAAEYAAKEMASGAASARNGEGKTASARDGRPPLPPQLLERQRELTVSLGPPGSVPLTRSELLAARAPKPQLSRQGARQGSQVSSASAYGRSSAVSGVSAATGASGASRQSGTRVSRTGGTRVSAAGRSKVSTTVSALNESLMEAKRKTDEANRDLAAAKLQLEALEAAVGVH